MQRKFTTVLALDVVGFSKSMSIDEDRTLVNLQARRKFVDQLIEQKGGRIFNTAGDSVLAEFPNPVDAVECGVQIQNKSVSINNQSDEADKMSFRIGLNMGEVLVSDGDLFGDAVNVAARLEAQAIPDGLCISESIFDLVNMKVKVSYEDAGELNLKNIGRPVRAYNVLKCRGATRGLISADAEPKVFIPQAEAGSVAIMLFKNLSNDDEQGYFCEGFSEDLISALSRYKSLLVISSNASFSYSIKEKTVSQIGSELGVRYLVEGKVRKMGPKMRISVSLLSAEDENVIWSQNFDTTIDDIFDVQDEIVATIVAKLVGKVESDQVKKLANKKPDVMEAYDLVLQGLEFHRKSSVSAQNNKKALSLFTQATEVDPNYARAFAWKTCSLANNSEWFPNDMPPNWMEDAFASVNRAMELDPDDPEAHRILGAIKLMFEGDMDKAIFHHKKAIEICPSDTFHLARYSVLLSYLGKPEEAMGQIEKALRINPFGSDLMFETQGVCGYLLKNYNEALSSFKNMQIETRTSLFYAAACHNCLGQLEFAKNKLELAKTDSGMKIDKFVSTQLYQSEEISNELKKNLSSIEESVV
ncbi:MAG: adenylate/guanylate cyclase domain-containing protein [Paracoccaceae bacterium]|nr:MAG: adenylate cyclase [Rhodobacter sp. BACL10 MAG-120910-bin24]KRP25487.1 MAG: adenylate cyclase [Rhodobacter sp. BACL10 MAG-120419-bin15]MDP5355901.1 adenylate/guanylate cyclase domain-containing protein [Paracoccaceae bacterium]